MVGKKENDHVHQPRSGRLPKSKREKKKKRKNTKNKPRGV